MNAAFAATSPSSSRPSSRASSRPPLPVRTAPWLLACALSAACSPAAHSGAGASIAPAPAAPAPSASGAPSGAADAGAASDGPVLTVGGGLLKIQVCTDDIVRVAYAKDPAFFARASLITAPKRCEGASFRTSTVDGLTTITTSKLTVRVDADGAVTFLDPAGQTILGELPGGGRTMTPATLLGEATTSVRQEWTPNADESLYGLGQHQKGLVDIKGTDLDLFQYNTEVFVPFLVSSRGYGILWDNASFTRFGDLGEAVPLPVGSGLYASGGLPGDVAQGTGTVSFSRKITPTASGDYTLRTFSTGTIQLAVNDRLVIDHYRQGWLPNEDVAHVHLTAGHPATLKLSWKSGGSGGGDRAMIRLLWKPPPAHPTTSLWSQVADGIDYWFAYGPDLDHVVAGYRRLTGEAPMMPKWAFGLWQCKERYKSAQEVLDVLKGYRDRGAPLDNIVQDWQYWLPDQWGSHAFDRSRYPDPAGWLKSIHDTYHAHLMISVWPRFYTTTANYEALDKAGFLYPSNVPEGRKDFVGHVFTVYDAFNPAARRLYWSQINEALFSVKVDAWWMDASEPEIVQGPFDDPATQIAMTQSHMNPTALGSGARMLNAFSLVNSEAIYEGQRSVAPDQRVFILTRSGFAGQQRYAAATWSGDITSTWTAMKKQIAAGLGFSISGVPYWTFDTGGFAVPPRFSARNPTPEDLAEWYELNTRWFEYATFVPILRVHGQTPAREMWEFGGDASPAYQAMLKFDRLRYRLLPYVYSLAGGVTQQGGTMLRPLVMDFRGDGAARAIDDEYMFGPALLVSPVTTYKARTRAVYLPGESKQTVWYDFWTGRRTTGRQTITADAPFDAMPLYVRAGSIVPFGPDLQYTSEKAADPITLYVYEGADGAFALYEDQGTTYDYERGAFTIIPLRWNDAKKTLTIGARSGGFPGMLAERTFQVVLVGSGSSSATGAMRPAKTMGREGFSFAPTVDKTVTYKGVALDVTLN
jgi:alpha-D-xyloside xylohydrolase